MPRRRDEESETPQLGEVLDFMRVLWGVDHGLQSISKRMEARLGVTGPQRLVVRILGRLQGISAGEIAGILRIHPSTLSGILKRLEKRGAIERTSDPADARRALFRLTDVGREIDALRSGTAEAAVRRALARMTRARVAAAQELMAVLADELVRDQDA
jgi:MarR family transcriptional regulator, organic hydroperoxide resistance regulator